MNGSLVNAPQHSKFTKMFMLPYTSTQLHLRGKYCILYSYSYLLLLPLFFFLCFCASRVVPPVDSLLFLQHRARNRKLRNRGVLVSSQAGCICFWSITGEKHTYGEWEREKHDGRRGYHSEDLHAKVKRHAIKIDLSQYDGAGSTKLHLKLRSSRQSNDPPVRWIYKQTEL